MDRGSFFGPKPSKNDPVAKYMEKHRKSISTRLASDTDVAEQGKTYDSMDTAGSASVFITYAAATKGNGNAQGKPSKLVRATLASVKVHAKDQSKTELKDDEGGLVLPTRVYISWSKPDPKVVSEQDIPIYHQVHHVVAYCDKRKRNVKKSLTTSNIAIKNDKGEYTGELGEIPAILASAEANISPHYRETLLPKCILAKVPDQKENDTVKVPEEPEALKEYQKKLEDMAKKMDMIKIPDKEEDWQRECVEYLKNPAVANLVVGFLFYFQDLESKSNQYTIKLKESFSFFYDKDEDIVSNSAGILGGISARRAINYKNIRLVNGLIDFVEPESQIAVKNWKQDGDPMHPIPVRIYFEALEQKSGLPKPVEALAAEEGITDEQIRAAGGSSKTDITHPVSLTFDSNYRLSTHRSCYSFVNLMPETANGKVEDKKSFQGKDGKTNDAKDIIRLNMVMNGGLWSGNMVVPVEGSEDMFKVFLDSFESIRGKVKISARALLFFGLHPEDVANFPAIAKFALAFSRGKLIGVVRHVGSRNIMAKSEKLPLTIDEEKFYAKRINELHVTKGSGKESSRTCLITRTDKEFSMALDIAEKIAPVTVTYSMFANEFLIDFAKVIEERGIKVTADVMRDFLRGKALLKPNGKTKINDRPVCMENSVAICKDFTLLSTRKKEDGLVFPQPEDVGRSYYIVYTQIASSGDTMDEDLDACALISKFTDVDSRLCTAFFSGDFDDQNLDFLKAPPYNLTKGEIKLIKNLWTRNAVKEIKTAYAFSVDQNLDAKMAKDYERLQQLFADAQEKMNSKTRAVIAIGEASASSAATPVNEDDMEDIVSKAALPPRLPSPPPLSSQEVADDDLMREIDPTLQAPREGDEEIDEEEADTMKIDKKGKHKGNGTKKRKRDSDGEDDDDLIDALAEAEAKEAVRSVSKKKRAKTNGKPGKRNASLEEEDDD